MQNSNAPAKIPTPFALSGDRNVIPESSAGIDPGRASFDEGFPPLTRTPISAGGIPPLGRDFNGILYALSQAARWANAGGGYTFDADFVSDGNVGGYPKGALLLKANLSGFWFNTVENNLTDPDSVGQVGWVDLFNGYLTSASAAASYAPKNGNVSAFVNDANYLGPSAFLTNDLSANGYQTFPGGLILQWGTYFGGSDSAFIAFPISFPNACFNVQVTQKNNTGSASNLNTQASSYSTTGFVIFAAFQERPTAWFAIGY